MGGRETVSQRTAVHHRAPSVQLLPLGEYVRNCNLQDTLSGEQVFIHDDTPFLEMSG